MKKEKIGLVLQGGGAKGAFQAGVLQTLSKNGVRWDFISGTSVGALNGSFLAQYEKEKQTEGTESLLEIWKNIKNKFIYRKWYWGLLWFLPALWKKSLYTTKPLRKFIKKHYNVNKVTFSNVDLIVGAVNLSTGKRKEWRKDGVSADVVAASSAFPIAFEPIEINGELYTDDGVREATPLEAAIKAGCTKIYVILTSRTDVVTQSLDKKPRLWDIALSTVGAMLAEIEIWDLKVAQLYNRVIMSGEVVKGKRFVDISVIEPSKDLGDPLDFNMVKAQENISLGRIAALKFLSNETPHKKIKREIR